MKILKKRKSRKALVILLAIFAILLGFGLMFTTEPITFKTLVNVAGKFLGAILFFIGFIVLKEVTEE